MRTGAPGETVVAQESGFTVRKAFYSLVKIVTIVVVVAAGFDMRTFRRGRGFAMVAVMIEVYSAI